MRRFIAEVLLGISAPALAATSGTETGTIAVISGSTVTVKLRTGAIATVDAAPAQDHDLSVGLMSESRSSPKALSMRPASCAPMPLTVPNLSQPCGRSIPSARQRGCNEIKTKRIEMTDRGVTHGDAMDGTYRRASPRVFGERALRAPPTAFDAGGRSSTPSLWLHLLPPAVRVQPARRSGAVCPAVGQRAQRCRLAGRAGAGGRPLPRHRRYFRGDAASTLHRGLKVPFGLSGSRL